MKNMKNMKMSRSVEMMGQISVFTHVRDRPNHFGCVIGVPEGRCRIFSFASKIKQDCRTTAPFVC